MLGFVTNVRGTLGRLRWKWWRIRDHGDDGLLSARFWTRYNVTEHFEFTCRQESLDHFWWRTSQYIDLERLMPCAGHDGETVLDYGCGPGNDIVGFVELSRPKIIYGLDVSPTSLEEARMRIALHGPSRVKLGLIAPDAERLPFENASLDYIHCAGVLHHMPPTQVKVMLGEFRRVLAPGGLIRIMVYNRDSVWVHLQIAWRRRLVEGVGGEAPLEESIRTNTDGHHCPVSRCYRPEEFLKVVSECGLTGRFVGAAISCLEMDLLPLRFRAILDRRLHHEHRQFLLDLQFDDRGVPAYRGATAGFDGVYELTQSPLQ